MRAKIVLDEIISTAESLSSERKVSFRRELIKSGTKFRLTSYSSLVFFLCSEVDISETFLCELSAVICRYRLPMPAVSYYEISRTSDFEIAFYSISVKQGDMWVRRPRRLKVFSYIDRLRADMDVYVIHDAEEAYRWFSMWGGAAVVLPEVFDNRFGQLL